MVSQVVLNDCFVLQCTEQGNNVNALHVFTIHDMHLFTGTSTHTL